MRLTKRVIDIAPSATLGITSRAKKMRESGIDVVSFGAGEPDFDTPSHIKEAAINAINKGSTKYTPSTGIPELKKAIAEKFQKDNDLNYEPSQIVVSCGAKHSIYNVLQVLCEEGDEVIIPSPYWVSYPEMVKLAGATPVIVDTLQENNFKLTEKMLLAAISENTRVIILNSPSNPTGCVYSLDEIKMVCEIAKGEGIYVISDEIYEKLVYEDNKHYSIGSLGKAIYDLTITVNGVSKSYAMTGWRIGYIGAPKEIAGAISNLQDHSTSNPASISQMAALAAITGDQSCVENMRKEFDKRRGYMIRRLNGIPGLLCTNPGGAFYAFCDISDLGMDSITFSNELLEKNNVAVVPGDGFGWDSHIRLSFAASEDNIKKGLDRLEEFVKMVVERNKQLT
ncbi:MAG: pyridoxal phosphate-dependent aminotransferase [Nitrospirae bacterium]|nr:pyridoxal phosphate-dependent aminotransferase [Nitrospirota bacterium]